jgi:hypothetical protein
MDGSRPKIKYAAVFKFFSCSSFGKNTFIFLAVNENPTSLDYVIPICIALIGLVSWVFLPIGWKQLQILRQCWN